MDCKKNIENIDKLSESYQREWNKCRALPSTELQEFALEATWTLPLSLHKQLQPLLIHIGRKGASKDCFEERPQCPETLLGRWGFLDKINEPKHSSFLLILQTERLLQLSQPAAQGGRTRARAIPWAQPGAAEVSFAAGRTHSRAGFAGPGVGVTAQEGLQDEGLQLMVDSMWQFPTTNASLILFYDSVSAPELGFVKKEVQHYKGERHSLPAHHHTPALLFPQTPAGQGPAPHKHQTALTHTHLPLLSAADPADLQQEKTIRRVQRRLPIPGHTHKPLGKANLGSFSPSLQQQSSQGTGKKWDPAAAAELCLPQQLPGSQGTGQHLSLPGRSDLWR